MGIKTCTKWNIRVIQTFNKEIWLILPLNKQYELYKHLIKYFDNFYILDFDKLKFTFSEVNKTCSLYYIFLVVI